MIRLRLKTACKLMMGAIILKILVLFATRNSFDIVYDLGLWQILEVETFIFLLGLVSVATNLAWGVFFYVLYKKLDDQDEPMIQVDPIMQKRLKKILIGSFIMILIVTTSFFGYQKISQKGQEDIYQNALKAIEQKDWERADVYLNRLDNYKNTEVLVNFVTANSMSEGSPKEVEAIKIFLKAIPDDYNGPFEDNIIEMKLKFAKE